MEREGENIDNATVTDNGTYAYKGSAWKPNLTVKYDTKTLRENTDYTLTCTNNINAGTASYTITGIGDYVGEKTGTFTITQRSVSGYPVSSWTYGNTPASLVSFYNLSSGMTLVAGTDYTIAYSQNGEPVDMPVNAGKYQAQLTLNNANLILSNSGTATVNIYQRPIRFEIASYVYGEQEAPLVNISNVADGDTLVAGTDYEITYDGYDLAGNSLTGTPSAVGVYFPQVTINNPNYYSSGINARFYIFPEEPQAIAIPTVSDIFDYDEDDDYYYLTYDGDKHTLEFSDLNPIYELDDNYGQYYVGEYSVTVRLPSPDYYYWSDGSIDDLTFNWRIAPRRVRVSIEVVNEFIESDGWGIYAENVPYSLSFTDENEQPVDCYDYSVVFINKDGDEYELYEYLYLPIEYAPYTIKVRSYDGGVCIIINEDEAEAQFWFLVAERPYPKDDYYEFEYDGYEKFIKLEGYDINFSSGNEYCSGTWYYVLNGDWNEIFYCECYSESEYFDDRDYTHVCPFFPGKYRLYYQLGRENDVWTDGTHDPKEVWLYIRQTLTLSIDIADIDYGEELSIVVSFDQDVDDYEENLYYDIYDDSGNLVLEHKLYGGDNASDLQDLGAGCYRIEFYFEGIYTDNNGYEYRLCDFDYVTLENGTGYFEIQKCQITAPELDEDEIAQVYSEGETLAWHFDGAIDWDLVSFDCNATDWVFDGNEMRLTIACSNENVIGVYTVTFTLSDHDNYAWENSDEATITYYIVVQDNDPALNVTFAGDGWTYGNPKTLPQINYKNECVAAQAEVIYQQKKNGVWVNCPEVNNVPVIDDAGEYKIIVNVTADLAHGVIASNHEHSFTVRKGKVTAPVVARAEYDYDEQTHRYLLPTNPLYQIAEGGQIEAVNVGKYTLTLELVDADNYEWVVAPSPYTYEIKSVAATIDIVGGGWTYGDTVCPLPKVTVSTTHYTLSYEHCVDGTWQACEQAPDADAPYGQYRVKVTITDTNYSNTTAEIGTFNIAPFAVAVPQAVDEVFTYTGEKITSTLNSTYFTVTNNQATTVGTYEMTLHLNNANFVWAGTLNHYQFRITPKPIAKPTPAPAVVYTGLEQTYALTDTDDYTVTTVNQIVVGHYAVMIELKDTHNTCWADDDSNALTYYFDIQKADLTISEKDGTLMATFNGETQDVDVKYEYAVENSDDWSTTEPTAPGVYTVRASIENNDKMHNFNLPAAMQWQKVIPQLEKPVEEKVWSIDNLFYVGIAVVVLALLVIGVRIAIALCTSKRKRVI